MRPPIRLAALMGLHVDPRLHPRQPRPRRRRADAPAGRAARQPARDPAPDADPPGRRQRDRGRLEGRDRDARPAGAAGADAPGRADARSHALRERRRPAPRRLRAERCARRARRALILIASGSEVGLIVAAAERLRGEGVAVRCVSMPSWELFDAQPQSYRDDVLPPAVTARLAVELGVAPGLAPLRRRARRRARRRPLRRLRAGGGAAARSTASPSTPSSRGQDACCPAEHRSGVQPARCFG